MDFSALIRKDGGNSSNSSSTGNNNNGGGNGNDHGDFIVAAVALVVSVIALLATFMQVLQQYYASAQGYSQCNERVMGGWAKTKSRRFQWDELRFEVQFDAPVIFVSPPNNKNGPIKGAPIFFLNGSKASLENTWTTSELDTREEYSKKSERERIHTADNERASWFVLLYALQRMEVKSQTWQQKEYDDMKKHVIPGNPSSQLLHGPPSLQTHHTLTAAVQRKRKSWDTMPVSVTRPYATTTMCHLIEMMAALGVYWKEFDRKRDRYWAEGNGFMVLGERLSDLGLMFSFQVSGQCKFEINRVIPVDEIKELCFGFVPTIFRRSEDHRRLDFPRQGQTIDSLIMGSRKEISETLTVIGCNNNTVRYFLDESRKTSHLFPISFEIIGMLSRTFHIRNSGFTYIPNPAPDVLDTSALSLATILRSFATKLRAKVHLHEMPRNELIVKRINRHIESIQAHDPGQNTLERYLHQRALHDALDDADEILTGGCKKSPQPQTQSRQGGGSVVVSDEEAAALARQDKRRQMVLEVLRHHIQEVVQQLNYQDDRMLDTLSEVHLHVAQQRPPSIHSLEKRMNSPRAPSRQFEEMDAAGPEERHEIFMDMYFDAIRYKVVGLAANLLGRRGTLAGSARSSIQLQPPPVMPVNGERDGDGDAINGVNGSEEPPPGEPPRIDDDILRVELAEQEVSHDDIWCTLVFRMICWLMLHKFSKNDIQVSKSELLGSRMPVYIS